MGQDMRKLLKHGHCNTNFLSCWLISLSHLLSVRALWLKWRMSWWRGSGWISATSSSSSSTIFMGVFCRSSQVQTVSSAQVLSDHYSFPSWEIIPSQLQFINIFNIWKLCPFTHLLKTLKWIINIQLASACRWDFVMSQWSVERTGRGS